VEAYNFTPRPAGVLAASLGSSAWHGGQRAPPLEHKCLFSRQGSPCHTHPPLAHALPPPPPPTPPAFLLACPPPCRGGMKPVPVTMLSGFLGAGVVQWASRQQCMQQCLGPPFPPACLPADSPRVPRPPSPACAPAGKTTLLRYVLQNSDLKVGCIVNDVASVNIDAKLIRGSAGPRQDGTAGTATTSDLADTIELANGCACCRWVGAGSGSTCAARCCAWGCVCLCSSVLKGKWQLWSCGERQIFTHPSMQPFILPLPAAASPTSCLAALRTSSSFQTSGACRTTGARGELLTMFPGLLSTAHRSAPDCPHMSSARLVAPASLPPASPCTSTH
jgi:hypothetical protein